MPSIKSHCGGKMKARLMRRLNVKLLVALLSVVLISALMWSPVSAGGGKVRGDNGAGGVAQHQVMDPPPFQP
jgi:hypothetical protein